MYLTDFRENTLQDVITKLEPDLFKTVTGLTVEDFHLLVRAQRLQHRAHEPGRLRLPPLRGRLPRATPASTPTPASRHYGLYDTVVARDHAEAA